MSTTMRKTIKAVFLVAITLAMVIALSSVSISYDQQAKVSSNTDFEQENSDAHVLLPSKRVSRFLTEVDHHQGRSLKAADHCNKDYEVCYIAYGLNSTCCGNKCFDLAADKSHCGSCHNKCKYTDGCCGGKCVDLAYDKRNCGSCGNKCLLGQYCIYGMCDYA